MAKEIQNLELKKKKSTSVTKVKLKTVQNSTGGTRFQTVFSYN